MALSPFPTQTTMPRQPKIINKALLTSCLLPSICTDTPPTLLKLLKVLKLHRESLIVTLADSNYAILGVLTSQCISRFEREYHRRITDGTVNNLLGMKARFEHWTPSKVAGIVGFKFHKSIPVLIVDEMEIVDASDDNVERLIEFVYGYIDTEFVVREEELQC